MSDAAEAPQPVEQVQAQIAAGVAALNRAPTARKRTRANIDADRLLIWGMLIKNHTRMDIWRHLNSVREYKLAYQTVCEDISACYELMREDLAKSLVDMKSRELASIARQELEAWEAWDRSRGPEVVITQKKIIKQDGSEEVTEMTVKKKAARDGNPAFMAIINACRAQRIAILGLQAPVKVEIGKTGEQQTSTLRERFAQRMRVAIEAEAMAKAKAIDVESMATSGV